MRRFLVTVALVVVALVGGTLAGVYAWQRFSSRVTPRGQPPLVALNSANFGELRTAFNASADRTRILALLSPT